jgi:phage shock protein A
LTGGGAHAYLGGMMNDLKRLFSRTWDAFTSELGRREPEDDVAGLLGAMRREMVDARANLPVYDEAVRAAEAELVRERRALDDAVRRGGLAEKINDAETVRIAAEFAERHRRRVAVLEEKVRAARAEKELRAQEVDDMMRRYKEADANRFGLLNEMRRARQQHRINEMGGGQAFDDFDRAAEKLESEIAYGEALDELGGLDPTPPPPPPSQTSIHDDVEARLQELKRRMGRA